MVILYVCVLAVALGVVFYLRWENNKEHRKVIEERLEHLGD